MRGETILCASVDAWSGIWRDRHQLMTRLSTDNRVLWVEPEWNSETTYLHSLGRNLRSLRGLRSSNITENLQVYPGGLSLPYAASSLPANLLRVTSPLIAAANTASARIHLSRVLRRARAKAPILWLYEPRHYGLAGRLNEKLVCYYVYDELAEFARNERHKAFIEQCDQALARRADVVFASSRQQYEKRRRWNANTYFTPNGVDFDHYHKAMDTATPLPPDIAAIPRPIAGFIGELRWQIDAGLLHQVAQRLPDWSLVLVGPDNWARDAEYYALRSHSNVHFLGRKDVSMLPQYLKGFDVALMPYRLAEKSTRYIYPCKLHEYLAGGKPTVATPIPELHAFSDVVRLADTAEGFVAQILQALASDSSVQVEQRLAVARQNTWDQRAATIRRAIDALLDPAAPSAPLQQG